MAKEKNQTDLHTDVNNSSKYRGDSVDEHKDLEDANLYLNEKEFGQQNNNL